MTSRASGEARAASLPTHGDGRPADSQAPLPADALVANGAAASSEQRDVDQASVESATSKPTSASGDEDKPEACDGPGQDSRVTGSLQTSQADPLMGEASQTAATPGGEGESAPASPRAQVQFHRNGDAPPIERTADVDGGLGSQATSTTETAEEGPEGPEALDVDTNRSQGVTEGASEDRSGNLQAQQFPPSPGGSAPPSPGPQEVALGRRSLDSRLYEADEENTYMRSMTSLLGGGEGTISSLADVLVWSETTTGMATAFLASGHSSVTDLLHSTGPSLRSVSSILGSTFSSGPMAGTSSALRSITHMLERVEQRTVEGVRLAVRYLTSHLLPGQAHDGPNSD
ncbi:testis-expressed protein 44 [Ursus americanus]|uniref:testis-expressed protein 44 n=1 Tax=Ursus americanus TaxID=9643 RepID=UPI001E67D788|nr:testis-expressed protein 44 [Ursus americanus]